MLSLITEKLQTLQTIFCLLEDVIQQIKNKADKQYSLFARFLHVMTYPYLSLSQFPSSS